MKVMAPKNKVESTIHAQGTEISILSSVNENEEDFISLTDLARYRNSTAAKGCCKKLDENSQHNRILRIVGRIKQPEF